MDCTIRHFIEGEPTELAKIANKLLDDMFVGNRIITLKYEFYGTLQVVERTAKEPDIANWNELLHQYKVEHYWEARNYVDRIFLTNDEDGRFFSTCHVIFDRDDIDHVEDFDSVYEAFDFVSGAAFNAGWEKPVNSLDQANAVIETYNKAMGTKFCLCSFDLKVLPAGQEQS